MTVYAPVMYRGEIDMLRCRLDELAPFDVHHVLVEATTTHRNVPRIPSFDFAEFPDSSITYRSVGLPGSPDPWVNEHAQRNAAWPVIDALANDDDIVLITDLDELPSPVLLDWRGPGVIAAYMRTCVFAVDWEVDQPVPVTCVAATVHYLRAAANRGVGLAEVRDSRNQYPVVFGGGWHLSWLGGPEAQRDKLLTATCHTELLDSPEGALIESGERYRTASNGGGLAVRPVDVDQDWPGCIYQRRCPASWFRPR